MDCPIDFLPDCLQLLENCLIPVRIRHFVFSCSVTCIPIAQLSPDGPFEDFHGMPAQLIVIVCICITNPASVDQFHFLISAQIFKQRSPEAHLRFFVLIFFGDGIFGIHNKQIRRKLLQIVYLSVFQQFWHMHLLSIF